MLEIFPIFTTASVLAHWDGSNSSPTTKKDLINGYDLLITTPESVEGAWDGVYSAPAVGDPGYVELLASDDGTLYTGGIPNSLTQASLDALNVNRQTYFCEAIWQYTNQLTANQDAEVKDVTSCWDVWYTVDANGDYTVDANGAYAVTITEN